MAVSHFGEKKLPTKCMHHKFHKIQVLIFKPPFLLSMTMAPKFVLSVSTFLFIFAHLLPFGIKKYINEVS